LSSSIALTSERCEIIVDSKFLRGCEADKEIDRDGLRSMINSPLFASEFERIGWK
jgi:hypothetical protein